MYKYATSTPATEAVISNYHDNKYSFMNKNISTSNGVKHSKNEPIPWPSKRIVPGGIFHTTKMEYSKETSNLLKLLMQESKMSMLMRKQINEHLRNGEPLPLPKAPRNRSNADLDADALAIIQRARNAKRKSLVKILASDAYHIPLYRPRPDDRVPSEKAKRLLQEAMAGVRLSETSMKAKHRRQETRSHDEHTTPQDIINELLDQINERADWLAEMEELGEGKKYRDEIRQQIAERLRQIKAVEAKVVMQKEGFRYIE